MLFSLPLMCSSIGPCDVTSKAELEKLVKDLSSKEKYLNLLVTNAGQSGPKNPPDSKSAAVSRSQKHSCP